MVLLAADTRIANNCKPIILYPYTFKTKVYICLVVYLYGQEGLCQKGIPYIE